MLEETYVLRVQDLVKLLCRFELVEDGTWHDDRVGYFVQVLGFRDCLQERKKTIFNNILFL